MSKLGVILGTGSEALSSEIKKLSPDIPVINRFGENHNISPSQVDYASNARWLKDCGCTHVLCTTAVGSFTSYAPPSSIAIPYDFIDFSGRNTSVYSDFSFGMKHTWMGESLKTPLSEFLWKSLTHEYPTTFGTILTIDGPRFSTQAESCFYRSMGISYINMTTASEVVPLIELGISPCVVGVVTDYDTVFENQPKNFTKELIDSFKIPEKVLRAISLSLDYLNQSV